MVRKKGGYPGLLYSRLFSRMLIIAVVLFIIVSGSCAQQNDNAVLFLSNRSGSWSLYTLFLATGEVSPFSAGELLSDYKLRYANLSADGTRLAFVATDYLANGDFFDNVFWLDLLTGQVTRITENTQTDSGSPVWSPDSTRLAYLSKGINGDFAELRIYTPATDQDQLVTSSFIGQRADGTFTAVGGLREFDWSPDGQQFVIYVQTPVDDGITRAANTLVLINTDGTNARTIADDQISLGTPRWSSGGDAIYVDCNFGDDYDSICRINPSTREISDRLLDIDRSVVDDARHNYVATMNVLPDDQIVFNLVSGSGLYLFDVQTGQVTNLSTNQQIGATDIVLGQLDLSVIPPIPSPTDTQ